VDKRSKQICVTGSPTHAGGRLGFFILKIELQFKLTEFQNESTLEKSYKYIQTWVLKQSCKFRTYTFISTTTTRKKNTVRKVEGQKVDLFIFLN
jgi:hypothetical protein